MALSLTSILPLPDMLALVLASSWVVGVLYWRDSRSATLAGPVTEQGLPC